MRTTKVAVGDEVKLQLYIADDASTFRDATGHVVRVEQLAPGDAGRGFAGSRFTSPSR